MIQNLTLLDIDMPQADSFEAFGVNEEDVQLDMMKLRLAAISQIEKEKRRWNLYVTRNVQPARRRRNGWTRIRSNTRSATL